MPYQEPDPIWAIFSILDFESYEKAFVVESRFHKDVPEDVVKSYAVAEQIMAHAYYYYPMYEEALMKLLRTMEMAIKMRCGPLGIDLTSGKKRRKELYQLIEDVSGAEADKELKNILQRLRELRNFFMHPERDSLYGTVAFTPIKNCVIVLNALFLPAQYFSDAKTERERVKGLWYAFEKGLFVLEYDEFRYVVYQSEVDEVYWAGEEWVYCCAFHAVPANIRKNLDNDHFPCPFVLLLKNLKFEENMLEAVEAETGKPLFLSVNEHPDNRSLLEHFQAEMDKLDLHQQIQANGSKQIAIGDMRTKLRYEYWGR